MRVLLAGVLVLWVAVELSHCRAVSFNKHGKAAVESWLEQLLEDDGDLSPAQLMFLKEREGEDDVEWPDHSAIYTNKFELTRGELLDTEGDDYAQLLRDGVVCVHPETHSVIPQGSTDFNHVTCLLCECPNGRRVCTHTC